MGTLLGRLLLLVLAYALGLILAWLWRGTPPRWLHGRTGRDGAHDPASRDRAVGAATGSTAGTVSAGSRRDAAASRPVATATGPTDTVSRGASATRDEAAATGGGGATEWSSGTPNGHGESVQDDGKGASGRGTAVLGREAGWNWERARSDADAERDPMAAVSARGVDLRARGDAGPDDGTAGSSARSPSGGPDGAGSSTTRSGASDGVVAGGRAASAEAAPPDEPEAGAARADGSGTDEASTTGGGGRAGRALPSNADGRASVPEGDRESGAGASIVPSGASTAATGSTLGTAHEPGGPDAGSGGGAATPQSSGADASAAPPPVASAAPAPPAGPGGPDDLKRIRGIGPKNAVRLNEAGITRFEQIAAWTPEDAEEMGRRLSFGGRIEREDWIGQARALAAGEETDFSRRVDAGRVRTSPETSDPSHGAD